MVFSPEDLEEAFQEIHQRNRYLERDHFMGRHLGKERFWVDLQPFLQFRGYRLRPRFQSDWKAPWLAGDTINQRIFGFEEAITLLNGKCILDAVRISDGARVILKRIDTSTDEIPVALHLSSPELQSDPRNHTVPILDVLLLPNDDTEALLVMPQLIHFDQLPFRRVREFTEAIRQFIEGLEFMHNHNVIHGDACYLNLMMDGSKVVPRGVHFMKPYTHDGVTNGIEWHDRTSVSPCRYFFIDFGLSLTYRERARWRGCYGQDKTVPEYRLPGSFDPLKVDIYQLGNVIIRMVDRYEGLEPFLDIATAMTRENPLDRISLGEALQQLDRIPKKVQKRRIWRTTCPPEIRLAIKFCASETIRSIY